MFYFADHHNEIQKYNLKERFISIIQQWYVLNMMLIGGFSPKKVISQCLIVNSRQLCWSLKST